MDESRLSDADQATYAWQLDVPGFGSTSQRKLKNCTALVSRLGGLGGPLAFSLAAAGVGRLVLAHGGNLKESDLNRQILMSRDWLGQPRVDCAAETLRRFKPEIEVVPINENVSEDNVSDLVARCDIVFSCAPLFEERMLLNQACLDARKPLVDAAMFNLEGQVTTVLPGQTACLECLYPELPPHWKRRFPVMGAVSALVANLGAMEGLKLVAGFGVSNAGRMLLVDTREMRLQKISLSRRPGCRCECISPLDNSSNSGLH